MTMDVPGTLAPKETTPGHVPARAGRPRVSNDSRGTSPSLSSPRGRKTHRRAWFPVVKWDRRRSALRIGIARTTGWRLAVQFGFAVVSLGIGIQFARFAEAARTTTAGPLPVRPPGVEGYLPISGLMGTLDWIYRGTLNTIHPAATVLFLTFVGVSLIMRKSFCGWICPAGFLSENLARLGRILLGRTLRPPRWLDVPLRGLKYLILGFFLWAIFTMAPVALHAFLQSPYNQVADVKMLEFFTRMSSAGWIILGVLTLLSVVVQGFWCRYLCPYGALLGLVSRLSPMRVRRNDLACTNCGICDQVCGSRLPVSKRQSIGSVECVGCLDCVVSCPVPMALRFGTRSRSISPLRTGVLIVTLFLVGVVAARISGHWYSGIPDDQMRSTISGMDGPGFAHPGIH